jgi:RNA polymerase sigma factor (sigma-70 family)
MSGATCLRHMSDTLPLTKPVDTVSLMTSVRPALVRFFQRRCKNLSQAEDLAQDVIVRTLGRAEWESVDQAQGYLFRTAANLWRDQIRHHRAKGGAELSWDEDIVNTASAGVPLERALLSEEALQRVHAALLQLNERTRDIFILSRLEQMKYSEIATMLAVSVSAVEKHMIKALAHLERQFDDDEIV